MSSESDPNGYVVSSRVWSWTGTQRGRAVLLWVLTLGAAGGLLWHSIVWFDTPASTPEERRRRDGNGGHVQIDFGGQWLMGRMIVRGHARELYHRQRQWQVAWDSFPVEDEPPLYQAESVVPGADRQTAKPDEDLRHDSEHLLSWFMGADAEEWRIVGSSTAAPFAQVPQSNPFFTAALLEASNRRLTHDVIEKTTAPAIGGPLYPPVQAFIYAPLGLIDRPQVAYRLFQVIALAFVFVSGLGVSMLTRGADLVVGREPGRPVLPRHARRYRSGPKPDDYALHCSMGLGAGVPRLQRRRRHGLGTVRVQARVGACLLPGPCADSALASSVSTMVLTGVGLAAATLPFVGLQTWFDWLAVGREAAALYNVNHNWIMLSRDLQGIPRRILLDFSLPEAERETPLARNLAWSLWGIVLATTVAIFLRHGNRQRATGVGIAFLFFGAFLTCYRFMYYDLLLSTLGFACLLAEPRRFLRTRVFEVALDTQTPVVGGERARSPRHSPRGTASVRAWWATSTPIH